MNWFWIALINPLVLSFVNHFDKYLLSRFVKGGTVGALIIFSSLFAVFALPLIFIFKPDVVSTVNVSQIALLMINGAFLTIAIICYLYALDTDETSYVVPFFELIPVFGLGIGYLILGESLAKNQLIAAAFIIVGSILVSIELGENKGYFKKKLAFLMIGSSFFYAINAVIFKYVATDAGFITSLFWDMAGKFLFGLSIFISIKSYQSEFLNLIKINKTSIVGLNLVNEILSLVGEFALVLAVLYAPVALVQAVGGFQSAFVFIIGVVLTLLWPKFAEEKLERKFLLQKVAAIILILIGVSFLDVF